MCQLTSKGYLHDLTSGRRKVSHRSFLSLCKGLKIKGPNRKLFQILCERTSESNKTELEVARMKIREQPSKLFSHRLPTLQGWDYIYSALGSQETGASLQEIEVRTKFNRTKCLKILKQLIELDVAEHRETNNRYYAKAVRNIYETISLEAEDYLASSFQEIKNNIPRLYSKREESLYRGLVFSIKDSSFPRLRERLKDLLSEFAQEAEFSDGNEIVKLVVGMEKTA